MGSPLLWELDDELEKKLTDLLSQMESGLRQPSDFRYEAVGAYLKLFLIQCHQACSLVRDAHPQQVEAGYNILRNFKSLVARHLYTRPSGSLLCRRTHGDPRPPQ